MKGIKSRLLMLCYAIRGSKFVVHWCNHWRSKKFHHFVMFWEKCISFDSSVNARPLL